MALKRKTSIKDTGFSSKITNEGSRLLNKNGSINIKKTGLTFSERFSFFHWFMTMKWGTFFLVLLAAYTVINTIFALAYTLTDINGLSGAHPNGFFGQFLDAFYFSAQTLTTVGYGAVSPQDTIHNVISTFESFIGLLSFAMSTGLLYGRFSKPKAKMMFSKNALITPFQGTGKGLMIRVANMKNSQLIDLTANLIISWVETENGQPSRKFQMLKLEYENIKILVSSWTIVHPILEDSPLFNWSNEDLKRLNVELLLQLNAYDDSYSQEIHSRSSYKNDEFIWGAKFSKILGHNASGEATIRLDEFDNYDKVEL